MGRLTDLLRQEIDDPISKGGYLSIHGCFAPPENVGFSVLSFGGDIGPVPAEASRAWVDVGGVDAFTEFECSGYVTHPAPLAGQPISLLVNALGSANRVEFARKGAIGDGFDDGRIIVRIYLAPDATERLLETVTGPVRGRMQAGVLLQFERDVTGFDPSGANLRLDLFDIKDWQGAMGGTGFRVCRLYTERRRPI